MKRAGSSREQLLVRVLLGGFFMPRVSAPCWVFSLALAHASSETVHAVPARSTPCNLLSQAVPRRVCVDLERESAGVSILLRTLMSTIIFLSIVMVTRLACLGE